MCSSPGRRSAPWPAPLRMPHEVVVASTAGLGRAVARAHGQSGQLGEHTPDRHRGHRVRRPVTTTPQRPGSRLGSPSASAAGTSQRDRVHPGLLVARDEPRPERPARRCRPAAASQLRRRSAARARNSPTEASKRVHDAARTGACALRPSIDAAGTGGDVLAGVADAFGGAGGAGGVDDVGQVVRAGAPGGGAAAASPGSGPQRRQGPSRPWSRVGDHDRGPRRRRASARAGRPGARVQRQVAAPALRTPMSATSSSSDAVQRRRPPARPGRPRPPRAGARGDWPAASSSRVGQRRGGVRPPPARPGCGRPARRTARRASPGGTGQRGVVPLAQQQLAARRRSGSPAG